MNTAKFLYIHGYGSNGNAWKKKLLQEMSPENEVLAPTFDYNKLTPLEIYKSLQRIVNENDVKVIVGSSTGGFYALACSTFSDAEIWAINPVVNLEVTFRKILLQKEKTVSTEAERMFRLYKKFQSEVFDQIPLPNKNINLALSTDDELLGDHSATKQRFANCGKIVELDNSGHHFLRFIELKNLLNH